MRYLLTLLILTLTSCSARWHLNQAIKKDPTIVDTGIVYNFDTTIVTDSIVIQDTLVTKEIDTLTIHDIENKVTTQIIRISDTLLVTTIVAPDTIEIIKQMRSKPRIIKNQRIPWYKNLFFWISAVLLVLLSWVIGRR
jgi:hypothetical protein